MPNLLTMRNKGILIFIFGVGFLLGVLFHGEPLSDKSVSYTTPSFRESMHQNLSFSVCPSPISPNPADSEEPAMLINSSSYGEVRIDGSTLPNSLVYHYLDQFNQSIQGANISTNWTIGQWTYNYRNNEYELIFYAPSTQFVAGSKVYVSISFSSASYVTCEHLLPMYVLINTKIIQHLGKDTIFFNQPLDLQFAWFTNSGDRISSLQNDPYRAITITLDNKVIDSAWWTYNSSQTNSSMPNIFIRIYFDALSDQNYIGFHQYLLICSKREDSRWYETQRISGIFEVIATPTYFSFQYSSAVFQDMDLGSRIRLYQFANNSLPLSINILYQNDALYLPLNDTFLPLDYGEIYGYIFDLTHNQQVGDVLRFISKDIEGFGHGLYYCLFETQGLDIQNDYNIIIFANTPNYISPAPLILHLSIISRWNVVFSYSNPLTYREGKVMKLTGNVKFSNGSAEWPAAVQTISILVNFIGQNQNATLNFFQFTDSYGNYEFSQLIVPNWDLYDYMIVTVEYFENYRVRGNAYQLRIEIEQDTVSRFWIPAGIVAGLFLFGTIIVLKVALPGGKIIVKRLGSTLREHPFFGPLLRRIRRIDLHHPPVSPLDIIEILHIPPANVPYNVSIDHDKVEILRIETDFTPKATDLTRVTEFIGKTVKDLQHTLFRTELTPQEIFAEKDTLIHNATLFLQKGQTYSAVVNFFTAYQFAVSLQLKEEMTFLEQMIAELLDRLTPYEKTRYMHHIRAFYRRARIFT